MKSGGPWTLRLCEQGGVQGALLEAAFRLIDGATPEELRGLKFDDPEFEPFSDAEVLARYRQLADTADNWFAQIIDLLPPEKRRAATSVNALLRQREGVGDPYSLSLDALLGQSPKHDAFRQRVKVRGRDKYFAAVSAYCVKSGATESAVRALLFANDMALNRARAKGEGALSLLNDREGERKAQLAAARESAKRQSAIKREDKTQRCREAAIAYLQKPGHGSDRAERVWAHVAQAEGISAASAKRYLRGIDSLRREARGRTRREQEARIAAAGGMRS